MNKIELIVYLLLVLLCLTLFKINLLESVSVQFNVDAYYDKAGFEDIQPFIDEIDLSCNGLIGTNQSMCIYYTIKNITGLKYHKCIANKYRSVMHGTCCRDWSRFWSKIFDHYDWDYQYILYAKVHHMRLDIHNELAYCMIDIREMKCFGEGNSDLSQ